jgi:hypothetical protein
MLCDFSEASSDHTRLEESEALYIRSIVEGAYPNDGLSGGGHDPRRACLRK